MKSKRANNDVLDGIRTVASYFGSNKLFISSNCKNLIEELHVYSWDEKAQARGVDAPKKENDHCCLHGNTLIYTDKGYIKIKDLLDTEGYVYCIDDNCNKVKRRYYNVTKTKENTDIIKLSFDNDEILLLTKEHPIFTTNRGWVEACNLTKDDIIFCLDCILHLSNVEYYGKDDVYNMEVDDVHNFATTKSNIITHNCDALRYGIMKLRDKDSIANATRNVGLW